MLLSASELMSVSEVVVLLQKDGTQVAVAAADSLGEVGWRVYKVAEQVVDGSAVYLPVVVVAAAAAKAVEQMAVV